MITISIIPSLRIVIGDVIPDTSRSILHAQSVTLTVRNASAPAKPARAVSVTSISILPTVSAFHHASQAFSLMLSI